MQVYENQAGRVTCLVDGGTQFPPTVFSDLPEPDQKALLAAAGEIEIRTEFNCYLLEAPGQALTLIDAGCGTLFGEDGGALAGCLADRGIAPEQIGRIIFTHLHRDHFGGALQDGGAVFPQAEILLHDLEQAHWHGTDSAAAEVLTAYAGQIRTVADGEELLPGVIAWHLPGHTPGHIGVRIGGDMVLVGDILHAELLQFTHPDLSPNFDMDKTQAADSRRTAMEEIVKRDLVYAGGHQRSPLKFARLRQEGGCFRKVAP